ncbi:hypothetical protein [Paraburkholderia sp. SIMBA_054]|uniref:hypothetical protein n=1 Tax=Paraburkholderia sp. SIMBA_054 TaxID=3085795 RepID=UPI00397AFFDD
MDIELFSVSIQALCIDRIRVGNGDVPVRLASNSRAVIAFTNQPAGQAPINYVIAHQDAVTIGLDRPNFEHGVFLNFPMRYRIPKKRLKSFRPAARFAPGRAELSNEQDATKTATKAIPMLP